MTDPVFFPLRVSVQGGSRMFSFIPLMHGLEGSTAEMKTEFQPYPPLPNIIILVFLCRCANNLAQLQRAIVSIVDAPVDSGAVELLPALMMRQKTV